MPIPPVRNPLSRFRRLLSSGIVLGVLAGFSLSAAPVDYDFYLCANINRNYVIGSKIVTTNGLFSRDETTGEWQHFGYNDTTITALAFDPRDRDVLYTTTLNGIWRSLDGGDTWRMTNSWDMTEGRDVAVDPFAPDRVYLALPSGIAVSEDRGQTWQRREHGLPDRGKFTQRIALDRVVANRGLAGCEKGVFLTVDAAANWRCVLPTETTVNDIRQSPHDPDFWVAVTDTHGAWESHDNGESWNQIANLPHEHAIYNVTFDATDANRLAVASWTYGVWTSEDGGKSWTSRDAGLPENPRVWRVGVEPNTGRLYASVFQETLYYSDDFGRTWTPDALAGSLVNNFVSVPRS